MLKRIALVLSIVLCPTAGLYAAAGPNIHQVSLKAISGVDSGGNLSHTALVQVLKQVRGLPHAFSAVKADQITAMAEEAAEAPWGTAQLFKVRFDNAAYIIKEIKKGAYAEIERLDRATHHPGLQPYIYPSRQPGCPQFSFPISYLSYEHKGKKHYLVIMPAAKGASLAQIMKEYKKDYKNSLVVNKVAHAFYQAGARLAQFYQNTKKGRDSAFIHGDAHMANIFYHFDHSNYQHPYTVTLIDNERICKSFHTCKSRAEDIAFLCMKSFYVMKWTNGSFFKDFPVDDWYKLYLPNFIAGYISVYPQAERKAVFCKVKKWIEDYKDPENGLNWYTDSKILGFSHEQYMKPIFNKLAKSQYFFDLAEVNSKDQHGKTVLHYAAGTPGETLVIWPAIAAGADVRARDNHDNTPLHEAAWYNRAEAVKALIFAGADINAKNNQGMTPLAKAKANGSDAAKKMLEGLGA